MHKKKTTDEKILDVNQKSFKLNEESLIVSRKLLQDSKKNLRFQGFILGVSVIGVLISFFIWQGVVNINLALFRSPVPDYNLTVSVNPLSLMLNDNQKIMFTLTFVNTGKKNITDLQINRVVLYREFDDQLIPLYDRANRYSNSESYKYELECPSYYSDTLVVGEKCTMSNLEFNPQFCNHCLDDKDKSIQLLVYFNSIPPLKNQALNLKIV